MRFDRLDLLRYGHLSACSLRFRPDARLHLVYGPNEAGKSTVLAAISDLLFGFPHQTSSDFLHEASSLRIAATLRNRAGETLAFRRRKGRKNTLLADSDAEEALRDDALVPFLGGATREIFERSFGLGSEGLREGGKAMLDGADGEEGVLFAAATGLHGVRNLRADLAAEADAIFAPRASRDRLFYQAKDRYDAAKQEEKERELRAAEWKALNDAIAEAQAAHEEADARFRETSRKAERLQRLIDLEPVLSELAAGERALAAYDDLAEVTHRRAEELSTRLEARERTGTTLAEAERAAQEALAARAAISVDADLLSRAEAIGDLVSQIGAYRERCKDLPRVAAQADAETADLADRMRRLGLGHLAPETQALAAHQPDEAGLTDLAERIAEGERFNANQERLARQLTSERSDLEEVMRAHEAGEIADPAPLRARFEAMGEDLRALERTQEMAAEHRTARRRLSEAAGRLAPPVADLDALARAPLPDVDALLALRTRARELAEARRRAGERLRELEGEAHRLRAVVADADAGGAVPSPEAIAAARQARDAAFEALRAPAAGPQTPDGGVAGDVARDGDGDGNAARLARYLALRAEADRLADRAVAEADRVSRHLADRSRLADLGASLETQRAEIDRLAAAHDGLRADLTAAFEGAGIVPGTADEMVDWRRAVETLLGEREGVARLGDRLAEARAREAETGARLAGIARTLGIDPELDGGQEAGRPVPVAALARQVGEALRRRTERFSDLRERTARRVDIQTRIDRLEAERAALAADLETWETRFTAALKRVGQPPETGLAAAAVVLDLWRDLPERVTRRDQTARRVAGMRRDNAAFEARVRELVAACAPDLVDEAPDRALTHVRTRLEAARTARTLWEAADRAVAETTAARETARHARDAAHAALTDEVARLPEALRGHDLADLVARLARRDALAEAVAQSAARFEAMARGETREAIAAELAAFNAEEARVALDVLEAEKQERIEALKEAHSRTRACEAEKERRAQAGGAEGAAFARAAAEAEMTAAGRDWLVLKLAETLLSAAMERHRAAQGNPVLERAGSLLADLTGGAFTGLDQSFDADDRPRLLALRGTGERVGVDGLSEGTCDQLYLALRLATLLDYAARAEPLPFIGDDLFQTFDDARTAAGLRALARLADTVQPILFTHHRSVVEIARAELGDTVDLLELA
ncbi:AAA family ATPase [Stappia sp.]|uniref:ATP-binding protein n=1 Tax=Stappia sp. TaxID=1870903 RepID=UPI0032D94C42